MCMYMNSLPRSLGNNPHSRAISNGQLYRVYEFYYYYYYYLIARLVTIALRSIFSVSSCNLAITLILLDYVSTFYSFFVISS